ncbi:MAG: hypothetical protein KC619_33840 [Myxococcales bacterium]|nr:hypothetical protein [Myxococcales bacterium]
MRLSLSVALLALLVAAPARAQVAGTVVEAATGAPIEGARVTVQATDRRTTTDVAGAFTLPGETGDVVVVGAARGFYNAPARATAPASDVEIRLEAVPPEDDPRHVFRRPEECNFCLDAQLFEWRASRMAHAGTNPWVHDLYDGSGTEHGEGGFVYARDSVHAAARPTGDCAACHQPLTWIASEPSALAPLDARTPEVDDGVACVVCHQIADVDETRPNTPGVRSDLVTLSRPSDPSAPVMYGVLGDVDVALVGQMRAAYNPELRGALCAVCHQDANDPDEDGDHDEEGSVPASSTWTEWLESDYADPTSATGATCVDCHMPPTDRTRACNLPLGYDRPAGQLRSHAIEGTSAAFLERALTLSLDTTLEGDSLRVDVTVENTGAGHAVPTGAPMRNVILLVEAALAGAPLESTGTQTIDALGGVGDPAEGYFAGLPGKLYARRNEGADGASPVFFTEATGIALDDRIAAGAADRTSYAFRVPAGVGGDLEVRARLIYRRAWRALVDEKQWTEDGRGEPLEDLAAPHFGHLMEEVTETRVVEGPDAGVPSMDAGAPLDAGTAPAGGGCGCRSAGRQSGLGGLLLVVAVATARRGHGARRRRWAGSGSTDRSPGRSSSARRRRGR